MNIERIPENEMEHLVTPYFRHQTIENVPQSEIEGRPIMEVREVVEIRFAGDKNYAPVLPIDAMYRRDGHRVVTYAERFADQYRAFVTGAPQEAEGTPLEMLKPYGISENQISLCRVLKIYSIEALHHLEGQNVRNLGMGANALKEMAAAYMADRARGADSAREMADLRAEVARLRALADNSAPHLAAKIEELIAAAPIPAEQASPVEVEAAVKAADDDFAAMTDTQLKAFIKEKSGRAPSGTPGRDFLLSAARELAA